MSITLAAPPTQLARLRAPRAALLCALALAVFAATFAALQARPTLAIERATGLYQPEGSGAPFRWTSSQAEFPLRPGAGPTRLSLTLSIASWPRADSLPVRVETDAGPLAELAVGAQPRRFQLQLPPNASLLRLRAPVARPPGGDWRWLGVQLHQAEATPSGWPLRALMLAGLAALASLPLALGLAWAWRRGYGPLVLLAALGLALRLLWLADSPPLLHRDEAVSLADAWNLAQTGRDHLGNPLPIAAFEAYGDWLSPLLTYLMLPWVALFGPSPLIARAVAAVCGALAVPAIYGLLKDMRLPVAAVCAALVAALSPWQIFLSRVAISPALVPATWALCLWAAARLVRDGRRRDALLLALAAGLGLYAYPTLKLAVPLLLALAGLLALAAHGWRPALRWWPAALLLALLWSPFAYSTLFNPSSGARLELVSIRAGSAGEWLAAWWQGYRVYFQPAFYYGTAGPRKIVQGMPGHGSALRAEALLLLGLVLLPLALLRRTRGGERHSLGETTASAALDERQTTNDKQLLHASLVIRPSSFVVGRNEQPPATSWSVAALGLLLLGALLIAPFPASLTSGNPHSFRAAPLAPTYAIWVGLGAAALWQLLARLPGRGWALGRALAALALVIALAWQSGAWYTRLLNDYPTPATNTWFFADQELEAMRLVAARAPGYDEVWLDTSSVGRPYIFLLLAQALPPAESQALIEVERRPPEINRVLRMGRYRFTDFAPQGVPWNLPAAEALPTRNGGPGYLLQEWQHEGRRILLVRSMTTELGNYEDDSP